MLNKSFLLTIQSPKKTFFNDQVSKITLRTELGYMGLLANHTPIIAKLKEGNFEAVTEDKDNIRGTIKDGIVFFRDNEAIVLTNDIEIITSKNFNLFEVPEFKKEEQ